MKLTIRKFESLEDWYLIVRAEHDGREWWEPAEFGRMFCRSDRLCGIGGHSADIEGTAHELIGISMAIRDRSEWSAPRCSVDATHDTVLFGSPRNDNGQRGEATYAEALDLASQIDALLGGKP